MVADGMSAQEILAKLPTCVGNYQGTGQLWDGRRPYRHVDGYRTVVSRYQEDVRGRLSAHDHERTSLAI